MARNRNVSVRSIWTRTQLTALREVEECANEKSGRTRGTLVYNVRTRTAKTEIPG